MPKNRLKLDFTIPTVEDRKTFIDNYLLAQQFIDYPPTNEELEMMGNYILWGKNSDGKNVCQTKEIQIDSNSSIWQTAGQTESLDALIEQPTFNEAQLDATFVPLKLEKKKFSRTEALDQCPEELRETFLTLFKNIDKLDLGINYYELRHGRRKNPPRAELLARFTEEEQNVINDQTLHWSQYTYLKQRHLLIELRQEQYILRDSFVTPVLLSNNYYLDNFARDLEINAGIEVLPLGLVGDPIGQLVYTSKEKLVPKFFSESQLRQISSVLWRKKDFMASRANKSNNAPINYIDFTNPDHVFQMVNMLDELDEEVVSADVESTLPALVNTLRYYIDYADLSDLQKDILEMKLDKQKNVDIARAINKRYGKSYTDNYISTIFRQKIIKSIAEGAKQHLLVVENLFFEENFKMCNTCGRLLLLDDVNFTKRGRSKDGYSNKCKCCEKQARAHTK